jgi:hypothetical protein
VESPLFKRLTKGGCGDNHTVSGLLIADNPEFRSQTDRSTAPGESLERRRRPTLKLQSHLSFWHFVAISLHSVVQHLLLDICLEVVTHRLRRGRVLPGAPLKIQLRNSG